MTALATQPTFDDVIAAVHSDRLPNRVASREVIRQAVMTVAAEHAGRVHVSWVRPLVPTWARGPQLGAALRIWTMAGCLEHTGAYLPNGDASARNASKPAPVTRLVAPIPPEQIRGAA